MVVVSYSGKEINAKLVYYGAGLSGKTTNLESIYEAVPEVSRGKMVSMKTQSDRTLFFDLLPLDLGEIMGFKTRFLLYTVPGQVFYNATRKLVLKGADAIVFVADSEVGKMDENKESFANLRANLIEYDLKLEEIPIVIQYNKRDLANVYSVEELNRELNPGGAIPTFEAVAVQGKGVFETFRGISHLLMEKVTRELRRAPLSGSRPKAAEEVQARAAAIAAEPVINAFGNSPATPATPATPAMPAPPATATRPPSITTPTGPPVPAPTTPVPVNASAKGAPPATEVTKAGITTGPMRPTESGFNYGRELSLPIGPPSDATLIPPPPGRERGDLDLGHHPFGTSAPAPSGAPGNEPRTSIRTAVSGAEAPAGEPRVKVGAMRESTLEFGEEAETTPARPSMSAARVEPVRDGASSALSAGATELVVPVAIPRGASREIVLRIVITTDNS